MMQQPATTAVRFAGPPVVDWRRLDSAPFVSFDGSRMTVESVALKMGLDCDPSEPVFTHLAQGRWEGVRQNLSAVPAHSDAGSGLIRYRFLDAPFHTALHQIVDANKLTPSYCSIHSHSDVIELNILVPGDGPMEYDVYLDGWSKVRAPAILWFPPGVPHCAVSSSGTGFFFVARLPAGPLVGTS